MSVAQVRDQLQNLDPVCSKAVSVPVYYINLDQSQDRRDFMESQLHSVADVTRIEGIDGTRQFPTPKHGLRQVGGCLGPDESTPRFKSQAVTFRSTYPIASTKLGCTLSHLKALSRIEQDGHDWAIVCEDDAVLTLSSKWPAHILQNLCEEGDVVGAGIIQLYWGVRSDTPTSKYHKCSVYNLVPMPDTPCWGTVAYLVSKKGVGDILGYTGRFPSEMYHIDPKALKSVGPTEFPNLGLLYVDDPGKSPRHAAKYAHLKRQQLNGVADSFLYGLTPTYTCGKPLALYDNCDMDAIVGNTNQPKSLNTQRKILSLYM